MSESNFVKTGIKGLDPLLLGGIPKGNIILVQGATGTGKTLMGLEFVYRGVTQYHEPGLIVVFETSPDKLIRDAAGFGWNLNELQREKKLQIIFTTPEVFDQELRSTDSLLLETANAMGAQRVFIDGIGLLRPNRGADLSTDSKFRDLLLQISESLNRENLTALLSLEVGKTQGSIAVVEMADFLADTVILLGHERRGTASRLPLPLWLVHKTGWQKQK